MDPLFAERATKTTVPIHVVNRKGLKEFAKTLSKEARAWIDASGYEGGSAQRCLIPGAAGRLAMVLVGRHRDGDMWTWASLVRQLPAGRYRIGDELDADAAERACLGWCLGAYAFDRYKKRSKPKAALVWPTGIDRGEVKRLAEGTYLVRDLVTTPASDMGPAELEQAARDLAKRYGARVTTITGDALLKKNYPAVHAVGRASSRAPRLIDLRWGDAAAPKVTLVGKGVCFDSGGLDLKSASGMLVMKKDMGGAAHVLGIALAIMDAGLDVRLRVLVPAVENSVSGNAFRPLDVLSTRKGITVEVGNTDAEGRLILCDALAEASSEKPEVLIDFATLTGAARVALGTELPALFCNDDDLARQILDASSAADDGLWRMPLHKPYARLLDSKVADTSNTASSRFGGAITAALFLQKFVEAGIPWAHVDVMAYNNGERAGRPAGGEAMGLRAFYEALRRRFPPAQKAKAKKTAAKKTAAKKTAAKKTAAKKTATKKTAAKKTAAKKTGTKRSTKKKG